MQYESGFLKSVHTGKPNTYSPTQRELSQEILSQNLCILHWLSKHFNLLHITGILKGCKNKMTLYSIHTPRQFFF